MNAAILAADRALAIHKAHEIVEAQPLYLDTETTGLGETAEIVDIAIIDCDGSAILSTLIRPRCPIPAEATAIHGITDAMVENAPQFIDIWPLLRALFHGRTVVTYNAAYDSRLIRQTFDRARLDSFNDVHYACAMELFARWYGEWNDYRNSYRWKSLAFAARRAGYPERSEHRALGDALAARAVVEWLAKQEE